MGFCIALWTILSRRIHTLDIKKKETKEQKIEQQRLSEQSHEYTRSPPSIQASGHEHRDSDHGHGHYVHRNVVPSPLQTSDWLDTEVADPLEDKPPLYDHNAARLPPYDQGRQREGSHGDVGNGVQINEPRGRGACTRMRITDHPDVNQGGAVIWYDALEDRYEVISRSLAPPTEPPLPPPYMPNRCVFS